MIYRCCDKLRRDLVAADKILNGIDYLEIIDRELADKDPLRQRTLLVYCLLPLPAGFTRDNVRISGGERVKHIEIEWAAPASPRPPALSKPEEAGVAKVVAALADPKAVLVVRVAEPGDFSSYTLRFAASATDASPPAKFDPQLNAIDFSFKVECPSDFDCSPIHVCPTPQSSQPDINYLAKDYSTFRRLLLDRMSQLAPQWQQSSIADYGITLVELFAYLGDQLSYQQDAIATEAYLDTARRRVSLRRHALLVDYPMHDGCNARAWMQLQVSASFTLTQDGTQFLTRCVGFEGKIEAGSDNYRNAMLLSPRVFEPLHAPTLFPEHNKISFYTWDDKRCCLPRGATRATLAGAFPNLKVGDVLLFEEIVGPQTGQPGDAGPSHRHVVRLTSALPIGTVLPTGTDPRTSDAVTEISWGSEDALPFSLCLSNVADEAHGSTYLTDISIARGNLVLVDHGRTISGESLGKVPASTLFRAPKSNDDFCAPAAPIPIPARYRPSLRQAPLTQAGTVLVTTATAGTDTTAPPFAPTAPAAQALSWSMSDVLPQIVKLTGVLKGAPMTWNSRRTLLASSADATDFIVEIDDDGRASLRFGDDEHGLRPKTDTEFTATYRVGNGSAGNVGAESIVHVVAAQADLANIDSVRNPVSASGGANPESAASVRRNAPEAFRTQQRAVTPEDYAAVTERQRQVQRAAATLRWTGSWYTVFITVDPMSGVDAPGLKTVLAPFVDRYRMAGHDLEFDDPSYVSLDIGLHVCVRPDYFRSDVKKGILELFSNRVSPDGRRGVFHPDNFTFGQIVYLSKLYAAVHAVPGVASARIKTFQRQGTDDQSYLADGRLPLGRLEIARLDNDPNFPEHGVLHLDINGGK